MKHSLIETDQTPEGDAVIIFQESMNYENGDALWGEVVQFLEKTHPKKLALDFSKTKIIDSAGIALLRLLWRHCRLQRIPLQYRSIPPSAQYFLRYVETEPAAIPKRTVPSLRWLILFLGDSFLKETVQVHGLVQFLGDFVLASLRSFSNLKRFRWRETLYYSQLCGSDAMPIVALLTFLMGLVVAFQAAVQLRQFGANIYVADLVGLAITRELGPIFTAVILAGRSGSLFAAEIGTMKVNEEVDALTVMGFEITQFLVLPKVFALAVCGPLLTMLANASGIFGGIVVGILTLDLTAASFLEETYQVVTLTDVATGLIKSVAFAVLVALIGCFRGLQAKEGADSVGRQTTSAVVSGIFLIIFADAIFTVLFHIFQW